MINTRLIKEYFLTIFLSACIACLVALPIIIIENYPLLINLLKSSIVGICIGSAARLITSFIYKYLKSKPFWVFTVIILVIAIGTIIGSYTLGLKSVRYYILLIALSEAGGLIATFLLYRYTNILNRQLHITQQKYKQIK